MYRAPTTATAKIRKAQSANREIGVPRKGKDAGRMPFEAQGRPALREPQRAAFGCEEHTVQARAADIGSPSKLPSCVRASRVNKLPHSTGSARLSGPDDGRGAGIRSGRIRVSARSTRLR